MTKTSDMDLLKLLSRSIPSSPYSWKMTSNKKREELIELLVKNREKLMAMELPMLIEGELYIIEDANDSQTLDALRVIKDVLNQKYLELKSEK